MRTKERAASVSIEPQILEIAEIIQLNKPALRKRGDSVESCTPTGCTNCRYALQ